MHFRYLSYAAIGMVIGHEITHGFDDRGRQFDKEGNVRIWWSQEVISSFKKQAQCIIDQYSGYRIQSAGVNVSAITFD